MHTRPITIIWLLLTIMPAFALAGSDGTGLQYSLAADIVGKLGLKEAPEVDAQRDRLTPREVELMFYGPIDHRFDGMISAAAHYEAGVVNFELHEAYVKSSKLLPRSRIKLGQYFLGVGRLNRIHRHDWPFISTPRVHEQFFDDEAAIDTGIEYGWLTPLPFYLDVVVGAGSGFAFGHTHSVGARPLIPTHYTRISTFSELGLSGGMEIGLNYLGRRAADNEKLVLVGLDNTMKWREGRVLRWLFQTEIWWRLLRSSTNENQRSLGGYFYTQYGFSETWQLGLRLDAFNELTRTNAITNQREKNIRYAVVPTLTFVSSEFLKFRGAYTFESERELSETQFTDHRLEFQATFILGAHPAHDF